MGRNEKPAREGCAAACGMMWFGQFQRAAAHCDRRPAAPHVCERAPSHAHRWRVAMALAPTLQKHLDQNVTYEVITHDPTMSSTRTAQACHVSGDRLAKAIVLRRDGGYMLAVLPASHHIRLPDLRQQIGDDVALADESEIKRLFPDCALGAVPAVGECYDLDVIVDDSIQEQPDVYLEGGDHTTLIHISQAQFSRLMSGARHGRFSVHD